jgi:hypothetical protein
METILKFVAVFSSGIFTGAAFYLTTVEHPARMSLGVEAALEEFRPSYKRAAPQQGALVSFVFYPAPPSSRSHTTGFGFWAAASP